MKAPSLPESGVYYETIAFPCGTRKYSMPVGLLVFEDIAYMKIYSETGFHEILEKEGTRGIILLSPRNPLLFIESLEHRLEYNVQWNGECVVPDRELGMWISCPAPLIQYDIPHYTIISCRPRLLNAPISVPYTRYYGCIVELLVYITKVLANVDVLDEGYIRRMLACIRRSAPFRLEVYERVARFVQGILKAL